MTTVKQSCLLLMLFTVIGCASGIKVLRYESNIQQVWPSSPEKARYRFVGQLTGERDFKATKQGGAKIIKALKWIVGGLLGESKPINLQRPQSGIVDQQGRIYVSDVNRRAVYVFDPIVGKLKVWQWAGERDRFKAPIGLVIFKNKLYVADSELGFVAIIDTTTGEPIGKIDQQLIRPTGLAIDKQKQELYVADTRKHNIKVYNLKGQLLRTIGRFGEKKAELNGPTHLAFANNRVYVADTLNARIQIFTAAGKFVHAIGQRGLRVGDFTRPKGIAVDRHGLIYVVESFYDHLLVFDQKGRLLLPISGQRSAVGKFYLPAGVWVDQDSQVYIADMFNSRVVVLKYLEGA